MKVSFRPLALLLLSLACWLAGPARASTLFVNSTEPIADGNNAFSDGGVYVAQDFFLSDASSLTSFTFNAFTDASTVPITDVNLVIYADNAGEVGGELLRGTFGLAGVPVYTESLYGLFDLYDFTVALPGWNLAAGNYWLGLNVGPAQTAMHWSIPGDNLGLGVTGSIYAGWQGDGTGDPAGYAGNGYDWEHVFRLEGTTSTTVPAVPEPGATVLLLGVGLAGLGLARRVRGARSSVSSRTT